MEYGVEIFPFKKLFCRKNSNYCFVLCLICLQVFFGLLKEPEFDVPLDDEDEEGENEEGKPKKKKPKKDSAGSKSKKQDPNAPPQNRYQGNDV